MQPAGRVLGQVLGYAVDVVLPPRCPGCGIEGIESQGLLCGSCFQGISFISPPFCYVCGVPFAAAAMGPVCPTCQATPPRYARARAALRYDHGARQLILPLKHADRIELAAGLVPFMVRAGRDLIEASDAIVPVPLHRVRLRREVQSVTDDSLAGCSTACLGNNPRKSQNTGAGARTILNKPASRCTGCADTVSDTHDSHTSPDGQAGPRASGSGQR
jgi:Double zinc ribbon domain